jgi:hypothetical protein
MRRRGGRFFQGFASYGGLWLGRDHLLSINSTRFAEDYKRFYFRDIQAFVIVETHRRRTWNIVLGILLVLQAVAALSGDVDRIIAFIPWLTIVSLVLLFNNALGPTCTVYIRTAVQVEELPSLKRVRRAQKVLGRIRPLIHESQAEPVLEELSTGIVQMNT